MKQKQKRITAALALIAAVLILAPGTLLAGPVIKASAAILVDSDTGEILYDKNAGVRRPPASTTKILTALLAIECTDLDRVVEVSSKASLTGEASLDLACGDKLSLNNLVHGALLISGNDACVAIAEAIAPSEEEFVGLMNLKARLLGAYDTTFYNTNGLPHNKHLTTAYDLAVITRYALKNPVFADIVRKKEYNLKWETPARCRYIKNTNKLLWTYPLATGVKTGTTDKAGKCLVASAEDQGRQVIAVLLNAGDRFGEARRLLEYGLKKGEKDAKR